MRKINLTIAFIINYLIEKGKRIQKRQFKEDKKHSIFVHMMCQKYQGCNGTSINNQLIN